MFSEFQTTQLTNTFLEYDPFIYICQGLPVPGVKKLPMNSSVVPTANVSYTDLIQGKSYNVPKFEVCAGFLLESVGYRFSSSQRVGF